MIGRISCLGLLVLALAGCGAPPRVVPGPTLPGSSPRSPIYFLKGDASLSPGARDKLRAWVGTWGIGGRWTLTVPSDPGVSIDLRERRVLALGDELHRLGVAKVERVLGPQGPPGVYDVIYVGREPE